MNKTLFGNTVLGDVIKSRCKMRLYWIRVGPNQNQTTDIFIRKGKLNTDTHTRPCGDGSRVSSDESKRQGMLREPLEARRGKERSSPRAFSESTVLPTL